MQYIVTRAYAYFKLNVIQCYQEKIAKAKEDKKSLEDDKAELEKDIKKWEKEYKDRTGKEPTEDDQ